MNEHSWYLLMSNILLGMGMCTAVKGKVTCDLALCTTIIFPFTFINYNSPLSVPKAHLGYILIYCSQSPRGIPGRYLQELFSSLYNTPERVSSTCYVGQIKYTPASPPNIKNTTNSSRWCSDHIHNNSLSCGNLNFRPNDHPIATLSSCCLYCL